MIVVNDGTEARRSGSVLGAAVGDALAFPWEGLSSVYTAALGREVVQSYKAHREGTYRPGQGSYLAQLMAAVLEYMSRHGRHADSEALGRYLYPLARDRVLVRPPERLCEALEDWARGRSSRIRGPAEPPLHLLPLAVFSGPQEEGEFAARLLAAAAITGQDAPESLGAAAAFFAAVRSCLRAEEIVLGDLLDVCQEGARRFSPAVARDTSCVVDMLGRSERDGMESFERYGSTSASGRVIAGIVAFLKSPYDMERALLIALRSGGGCQTAFTCGALSGAFLGQSGIPKRLRGDLVMGRTLEQYLRAVEHSEDQSGLQDPAQGGERGAKEIIR